MPPTDAPAPMNEGVSDTAGGKKSALRRFGPLAVLLVLIAVAWAAGLRDYLSLRSIVEHRDWLQHVVADRFLLAVAAYTGIYVLTVAFSLPGATVLTVFGGFLFGWFAAGVATVIGATIGATAVFLIAQTSIGDALSKKAGPFARKLADGFREDAFHYMLFLRLVPVFPFWLVNIAPALFEVPLRTYVITTLIGIIPGTFAFAILGSGLDSIITQQQEAYIACMASKPEKVCEMTLDPSALVTPQMIAAFVALGVVALIPVAIKHMRKKGVPG